MSCKCNKLEKMNKFNKDSVSSKELIMEFYIKNNKQQVIKIENESSRRTT